MDRIHLSKVTFLIVILSMLLVQEVKTRSTWTKERDHRNHNHLHHQRHQSHQSLHSALRHSNLKHPRHWHSTSQLADDDHAEVKLRHQRHLLKKRNDDGSTNVIIMNEKDEKALYMQHLHQQHDKYDVLVKEAQNSSLCNYTVTPLKNIKDYDVPQDLVDITCNHIGSRCQEVGTYCCVQTFSQLNVTLVKGGTRSIRINTGCVCALRLFGSLKQDHSQPNLNL